MARINIEDSLFRDGRWIKLLLKVGCEHKALGLLCGAWILSQKNWVKHKCIPAYSWPKDFNILIDVELAATLPDGSIYVKGSERAFTWLSQKSEAGKIVSDKKNDSLKKARAARWNKTDSRLNGSERDVNGSIPLTPTLTLIHKEEEGALINVTDNKNPTAVFDSRFNKEVIELSSLLEQKLGKRMKRLAPKIFEHFGSKEEFIKWSESVCVNYQKSTLKGKKSLEMYLSGAIQKELRQNG